MKRNASKRYERHDRSRHRPTKVFEFATLKVAIMMMMIGRANYIRWCFLLLLLWVVLLFHPSSSGWCCLLPSFCCGGALHPLSLLLGCFSRVLWGRAVLVLFWVGDAFLLSPFGLSYLPALVWCFLLLLFWLVLVPSFFFSVFAHNKVILCMYILKKIHFFTHGAAPPPEGETGEREEAPASTGVVSLTLLSRSCSEKEKQKHNTHEFIFLKRKTETTTDN